MNALQKTSVRRSGGEGKGTDVVRFATWNVERNRNILQDTVERALLDDNIDVLALHEVDYYPDEEQFCVLVDGYEMYVAEVERVRGKGGTSRRKVRTVCLVREGAFDQVVEIGGCSNGRSEVWLRMKTKGCKDLVYAAVYSEWTDGGPGIDNDDFVSQLKKRADADVFGHGDFNVDVDRVEGNDQEYAHRKVGEKLVWSMETLGLDRHSSGVTRRRVVDGKLQESALDWSFSNLPGVVQQKKWKEISDHAMLITDVPYAKRKHEKKIRVRSMQNLESEACVAHFNRYDWASLTTMTTGEAAAFLQRSMTETKDRFAPPRWVKPKPRVGRKPTCEEMKLREELFRDLKMGRHAKVGQLRRRLRNMVKKNTVDQMAADINEGKTNMWREFGRLTKKGRTEVKIFQEGKVVGSKKAADLFLKYFSDKVERIKSGCNPVTQKRLTREELRERGVSHFGFRQVTEEQVRLVIKETKPSRSEDKWGVTPLMLKKWAELDTFLVTVIWYIINQIIIDGEIPAEWKTAKIFPDFKRKGNRHEVKSYRPISILDPASKIMEAVLNKQLVEHMESRGLVPNSQHGYRRNRSTISATTHLAVHIDKAMREKKKCAVICYDYSSAFDCVDGDILGAKLQNMGMARTSVDLIRSYMKQRTVFVEVGDGRSKEVVFPSMAPQGSKISPSCYLLLAADLPHHVEKIPGCSSITFADDTNIVITAETLGELKEKMVKVCGVMTSFSGDNGLSLNASKTEYILVQKRTARADGFQFEFGGEIIEESVSVRFLGVQLSKDLSGQAHLDSIKSEVGRRISVIRKLQGHFPFGVLQQFIKMNIQSKLHYALEAWSNVVSRGGRRLLEKVDLLTKESVRASLGIFKSSRIASDELWKVSGLERAEMVALQKTTMAAFQIYHEKGAWGFLRPELPERPQRDRREQYRDLVPVEMEAKSLANKAAVVYNGIPKLMKYASDFKEWKVLYQKFKNVILGNVNEGLR